MMLLLSSLMMLLGACTQVDAQSDATTTQAATTATATETTTPAPTARPTTPMPTTNQWSGWYRYPGPEVAAHVKYIMPDGVAQYNESWAFGRMQAKHLNSLFMELAAVDVTVVEGVKGVGAVKDGTDYLRYPRNTASQTISQAPYGPGEVLTLVDIPLQPVTDKTDIGADAPASWAPAYVDAYTPIVAAVAASSGITRWDQFMDLCKKKPGQIVAAGSGGATGTGAVGATAVQYEGNIKFKSYLPGYNWVSIWGANDKFINNVTVFFGFPSMFVDTRFIPLAVSTPSPLKLRPTIPTFLSLQIKSLSEIGLWHSVSLPNLWQGARIVAGNALRQLFLRPAYQGDLTAIGAVALEKVYGTGGNAALGPGGINANNTLALQTFVQAMTKRTMLVFKPIPTEPPFVLPLVDETKLKVSVAAVYTVEAGAAIGIGLTFFLGGSLYKYRHHPVMTAASLPFLFVMIVGAMLGFVSLVMLALLDASMLSSMSESSLTQICRSFPFVFGVAFNMVFAPLFAKTRRLYTIFYNKDLTTATGISNTAIAHHIGVLLIVEMAFQVVWLVADPMTFQSVSVDGKTIIGGGSSTYECHCSYRWWWIGVMIATKAILLSIGVALAFLTRNLDSQFNESRSIAFCLYNIFFCGVVFLPVIYAISNNGNEKIVLLQYLLMTGSIWICTMIILAMIFAPKIYLSYSLSPTDAQAQFMFKRSSKRGKGTGANASHTNKDHTNVINKSDMGNKSGATMSQFTRSSDGVTPSSKQGDGYGMTHQQHYMMAAGMGNGGHVMLMNDGSQRSSVMVSDSNHNSNMGPVIGHGQLINNGNGASNYSTTANSGNSSMTGSPTQQQRSLLSSQQQQHRQVHIPNAHVAIISPTGAMGVVHSTTDQQPNSASVSSDVSMTHRHHGFMPAMEAVVEMNKVVQFNGGVAETGVYEGNGRPASNSVAGERIKNRSVTMHVAGGQLAFDENEETGASGAAATGETTISMQHGQHRV